MVGIDAESGDVVRRIPAGRTPSALAVGDGALWLVDADARTVLRIVPSSRVIETLATGATPTDIAFGAGSVWVANGRRLKDTQFIGPVATAVARLDPTTRTERTEVAPASNRGLDVESRRQPPRGVGGRALGSRAGLLGGPGRRDDRCDHRDDSRRPRGGGRHRGRGRLGARSRRLGRTPGRAFGADRATSVHRAGVGRIDRRRPQRGLGHHARGRNALAHRCRARRVRRSDPARTRSRRPRRHADGDLGRESDRGNAHGRRSGDDTGDSRDRPRGDTSLPRDRRRHGLGDGDPRSGRHGGVREARGGDVRAERVRAARRREGRPCRLPRHLGSAAARRLSRQRDADGARDRIRPSRARVPRRPVPRGVPVVRRLAREDRPLRRGEVRVQRSRVWREPGCDRRGGDVQLGVRRRRRPGAESRSERPARDGVAAQRLRRPDAGKDPASIRRCPLRCIRRAFATTPASTRPTTSGVRRSHCSRAIVGERESSSSTTAIPATARSRRRRSRRRRAGSGSTWSGRATWDPRADEFTAARAPRRGFGSDCRLRRRLDRHERGTRASRSAWSALGRRRLPRACRPGACPDPHEEVQGRSARHVPEPLGPLAGVAAAGRQLGGRNASGRRSPGLPSTRRRSTRRKRRRSCSTRSRGRTGRAARCSRSCSGRASTDGLLGSFGFDANGDISESPMTIVQVRRAAALATRFRASRARRWCGSSVPSPDLVAPED